MSKSKNSKSNYENFRSKWDMPHSKISDYKRSQKHQIIKEELEELEEENLEAEEWEEEAATYFNQKGKNEI